MNLLNDLKRIDLANQIAKEDGAAADRRRARSPRFP
jgi:hypothetical protein